MTVDESMHHLSSDESADEYVGPFTMSELAAYAASGRSPVRDDIEQDVEARRAVTQLQRLRGLMDDLVIADGAVDHSWFQNILRGLNREVRHGRTVPLNAPTENAEFTISEGALKALIRTAGGSVPSAIIGRIDFVGDLALEGSPIGVAIEAAVLSNTPIPDSAEQIRSAVVDVLRAHTRLAIDFVDVTIIDVVHKHDQGEDHD